MLGDKLNEPPALAANKSNAKTKVDRTPIILLITLAVFFKKGMKAETKTITEIQAKAIIPTLTPNVFMENTLPDIYATENSIFKKALIILTSWLPREKICV